MARAAKRHNLVMPVTDLRFLAGTGATIKVARMPVEPHLRFDLMEDADYTCSICGERKDSRGRVKIIEVDHILPIGSGISVDHILDVFEGSQAATYPQYRTYLALLLNSEYNLRVVCVKCHEKLHPERVRLFGMTPWTYEEKLEMLRTLVERFYEDEFSSFASKLNGDLDQVFPPRNGFSTLDLLYQEFYRLKRNDPVFKQRVSRVLTQMRA